MSANPATNEAKQVNDYSKAEPNGTVDGDTTAVVSNSSYRNSTSAARLAATSQARHSAGLEDLPNATRFIDRSLAVFGNTSQGVILEDRAGVTYGLDGSRAVQIGGALIDATSAKRVVVTLGNDGVDNAATRVVPTRYIPQPVSEAVRRAGRFNTLSLLSDGADQYTGSSAKDLVSLGKGKDRAVLGQGHDLALMDQKLSTKRLALGDGRDALVITEDALRRGGKVVIDDFSRKQDTVHLETKASRVKGIGTDKLRISGKGGNVVIRSEQDRFSRSSLEFFG